MAIPISSARSPSSVQKVKRRAKPPASRDPSCAQAASSASRSSSRVEVAFCPIACKFARVGAFVEPPSRNSPRAEAVSVPPDCNSERAEDVIVPRACKSSRVEVAIAPIARNSSRVEADTRPSRPFIEVAGALYPVITHPATLRQKKRRILRCPAVLMFPNPMRKNSWPKLPTY